MKNYLVAKDFQLQKIIQVISRKILGIFYGQEKRNCERFFSPRFHDFFYIFLEKKDLKNNYIFFFNKKKFLLRVFHIIFSIIRTRYMIICIDKSMTGTQMTQKEEFFVEGIKLKL